MSNREPYNTHDLDQYNGIDCTMAVIRFAPELGFRFAHKSNVLFIQVLCFSLTLSYDNNMLFYDYPNVNTINIAFHFSKIWGLWVSNRFKNLFGMSLGYVGIYISYGKEFIIRKKGIK